MSAASRSANCGLKNRPRGPRRAASGGRTREALARPRACSACEIPRSTSRGRGGSRRRASNGSVHDASTSRPGSGASMSQPNAIGSAGSRRSASPGPARASPPGIRASVWSIAEGGRQEVLVGVAGGEDQAADPLGVARDDELARSRRRCRCRPASTSSRSSGLEEVGDQPRERREGRGRRPGSSAMRCEPSGRSGTMQRKSPSRRGHDLVATGVPSTSDAVDEDDRLAGARVAVADRPVGEVDGLRCGAHACIAQFGVIRYSRDVAGGALGRR